MEKKDHKVTIKEYGLLEWLYYHYDNDLLFGVIARICIPIIVSFITTLIVIRCK